MFKWHVKFGIKKKSILKIRVYIPIWHIKIISDYYKTLIILYCQIGIYTPIFNLDFFFIPNLAFSNLKVFNLFLLFLYRNLKIMKIDSIYWYHFLFFRFLFFLYFFPFFGESLSFWGLFFCCLYCFLCFTVLLSFGGLFFRSLIF